MDSPYSDEILESFSKLIVQYDSKYSDQGRVERELRAQFNLFIQLIFMKRLPDPRKPDLKFIESFLAPAKSLDLEGLRREALRRFYELTKEEAPLDLERTSELNFPNFMHKWFWRQYAKIEFARSRGPFNGASTDEIIELERNGLDYYRVCHLAYPPNEEVGHDNVHLESHKEVAELLKNIMPKKENGAYKILEYGCGDGRLLWVLRQHFPKAELKATNIFGNWGVINAVKKDPGISIVSLASVEEQDFDSDSFDAVLSTEVIEHLVKPEEMILAAKKVLKPGGAFIITAPSLHYEFLSNNPFTYFWSFLSVLWVGFIPRFHNMWQPLAGIPIVHYAFGFLQFKRLFRKYFKNAKTKSTRFTHLKKLKLDRVAPSLPLLKRWGGLLVAYGNKDE